MNLHHGQIQIEAENTLNYVNKILWAVIYST